MRISSLLIMGAFVIALFASTTVWAQSNRRLPFRMAQAPSSTVPIVDAVTGQPSAAGQPSGEGVKNFLKPESIVSPPRDKEGRIIPEAGGNITLPDGTKVKVTNEDPEKFLPGLPPLKTLPKTQSIKKSVETPAQNKNASPAVPNPYGRHSIGGRNHCLAANYYPGFFGYNAERTPSYRRHPPVEAFGKNLYGQPCSYGTLSARLGCGGF